MNEIQASGEAVIAAALQEEEARAIQERNVYTQAVSQFMECWEEDKEGLYNHVKSLEQGLAKYKGAFENESALVSRIAQERGEKAVQLKVYEKMYKDILDKLVEKVSSRY